MTHGTTKSGAVISGDMILESKLVWSQRGCEVLSGRKDLHQKSFPAERTYISEYLPPARLNACLSVYPHRLSYFNESAGGPINGWKHLDCSNIEWGQDMVLVKECVEQHPQVQPLHVHSTGYVTPQRMGIETQTLQLTTHTSLGGESLSYAFALGW